MSDGRRASVPTLDELRPVCQPEEVVARVNGEHWAGRLYMRRVSLRVTRRLLRTGVGADAVTWAMIAAGLLAALVLTVPHPLTPVAAFVLVQLQLLLVLFECLAVICQGPNISCSRYFFLHQVYEATENFKST